MGKPEGDAEKMVEMVTENDGNGNDNDNDNGNGNNNDNQGMLPPGLTQHDQLSIYQSTMAKCRPNGFSRQDGWLGKTYLDAYDFCGQQEGGRTHLPLRGCVPHGSQHAGPGGIWGGDGGLLNAPLRRARLVVG